MSWAISSRLGVILAVLEALLEAILAVWKPKRAPESKFRGGRRFQRDAYDEGGVGFRNTKQTSQDNTEAF